MSSGGASDHLWLAILFGLYIFFKKHRNLKKLVKHCCFGYLRAWLLKILMAALNR